MEIDIQICRLESTNIEKNNLDELERAVIPSQNSLVNNVQDEDKQIYYYYYYTHTLLQK